MTKHLEQGTAKMVETPADEIWQLFLFVVALHLVEAPRCFVLIEVAIELDWSELELDCLSLRWRLVFSSSDSSIPRGSRLELALLGY